MAVWGKLQGDKGGMEQSSSAQRAGLGGAEAARAFGLARIAQPLRRQQIAYLHAGLSPDALRQSASACVRHGPFTILVALLHSRGVLRVTSLTPITRQLRCSYRIRRACACGAVCCATSA